MTVIHLQNLRYFPQHEWNFRIQTAGVVQVVDRRSWERKECQQNGLKLTETGDVFNLIKVFTANDS